MARIGSYPIDAVIQDKDAWIGTENTNRVTRQFTAKGIAEYIDTKNVGLVFVGATALADGKKGLVPAPVAGQEGMYLKGDLNGGWTTIPVYTLDVPAGTTNVNLINTDGAGAIINSFITLTGGTYLTSVHTSGSQITFNHDNTTRSDTTSTASPAAGASVPLVASVTSNATGHITAIDVKTVTWPADSDTTYTIDVPNATTSINLAGSDGTNDPIAFTTVAGNNGMTISRTDANTLNFNSKWQINNVNQDGYVPKGTANANKFWATDANGNPGWTFQPSQDQTLTSTGTTNASTGIVLSQNGGTVIVKGDGSTISASSNNNTNTITLAAINRVNTTYTLPVAAGAANTAVINLTDNSSVVSSVTFNGTANKIAISETVGNNGDITIGMPDDVTVTGELTVSGTGQSSFGGQVTIPQTPTADTDAASKKYVDDLVSGGLTFRGTFRADTGEILSGVSSGSKLYNCPGGAGTRIAVAVGDYYIVATAGGSFYCSGATLDIGDSIIATAAANADASVVTGWSVVQSDEGVASFTNANGTFVSAGTVNSNATGAVTMGTIDLSATGTKNNTTFLRGDNTWAVPAYVSYSAMTTSTLGLGKIKYDFGSTPAAESQSTTAARTYGVTKNASDQLVVNVPWVNSSDVNSVTASGATTALSGLTSTPNTGSVVIGLDINGRASLGAPASDDELMIYDTSTAKNVKVLVSDLASYAGSAATNQVTYWTSANEIGGAAGFTFAGGANGAVTMGGTLTVSGNATINGTIIGTDQTFAGEYRTFAFGTNSNGYNRIFATRDQTDGIYLASATGHGLKVRVNGNSTNVVTIDSSGNAVFTGNINIQNASTPLLTIADSTNNVTLLQGCDNTNTFIRSYVGPILLQTNGGTTALTLDSSQKATFAGDVSLADNKKLLLGTGNDLEIYHNASNSYISEVGTGSLFIQADDQIRLDSPTSGEKYARFNNNGNVELYYNNSLKLETTSTGIKVSDAGTVKKIVSYFDGDYTSGFKFSDLNGGIWYDAGADDLYLNANHANSQVILQSGGSTTLTLDSSNNATFTGDIQAPGIYVGATNVSFDFYNQGTSYFNGNVTVDATLLISGVSNYTGLEIQGSGGSRPQLKFSNVNNGVLGTIFGTESNGLVIATGSSSTTAVTIDNAQNVRTHAKLGIRVDGDAIPWRGTAQIPAVINLAGNGAVFTRPDNTFLSQNFYYNASDAGAVIDAGQASVIQLTAGEMKFMGSTTGAGSNATISLVNRMVIDNAGNIGMGIDVPTEKLDIVKSSGNTNIRVYDSSGNSEVGLKLQNDAKTWTLQNWGSGGDKLRVLNNDGNSMQVWEDDGNVIFGAVDINGSFGASNTIVAIKGSASGGEGILQITGLGNSATDNVGRIDFHSYNETDPMCSIRSVRGSADDEGELQFYTNEGGTPKQRLTLTKLGALKLNSDSNTDILNHEQTLTIQKGLSAAGTAVPIAFVDHTHALDITVIVKQDTSNVASGIGRSLVAYGAANTGMSVVQGSGNVTGITLAYLNTNPSGQDYVLTLNWSGSGASPTAHIILRGNSQSEITRY